MRTNTCMLFVYTKFNQETSYWRLYILKNSIKISIKKIKCVFDKINRAKGNLKLFHVLCILFYLRKLSTIFVGDWRPKVVVCSYREWLSSKSLVPLAWRDDAQPTLVFEIIFGSDKFLNRLTATPSSILFMFEAVEISIQSPNLLGRVDVLELISHLSKTFERLDEL